MKTKKMALATGVVAGIALGLTISVQAERTLVDRSQTQLVSALPVDEVRELALVFGRIKEAYVDEVDDKTLIEYAINGMLSGLDPHSTYLTPKDFQDLQVSTSGQFGGLGIEITSDGGFVRVVAPIDDTPALRAGIQAGDLITHLNGESIQGWSLERAIGVMRGEPGTSIDLTVSRAGDAPQVITIVRDIIRVRSVRYETLEPGFGYLRISTFQARTAQDVIAALGSLQADGALKGLVLDLRNNPGGLLDASIGVADAFLTEGAITYTEGRLPNSNSFFSATRRDPSQGVNLVVLINSGSASASEIVAGALQDNGRAIIMGDTSFGKGSVQSILPITSDTRVKLTTARYFTPNGRSIQAKGIEPDVFVPMAKVETVETIRFREADLGGAMRNSSEQEPAETAVATPVEPQDDQAPLIERDYQLHQALTMLKGMAVFRR